VVTAAGFGVSGVRVQIPANLQPHAMSKKHPHEHVYARIGLSDVHGVGVCAIRDIPKGTLVFKGENERVAWRSRAWVRKLPKAFRDLYEDFGMVDGNLIGVPPSLNNLSVGWYINHSETPNVWADDDGRFRALRRIKKGEELTADYRTFADEPLTFRPKPARPSRAGRRPKRR
jgi:SET domain-containing protein